VFCLQIIHDELFGCLVIPVVYLFVAELHVYMKVKVMSRVNFTL